MTGWLTEKLWQSLAAGAVLSVVAGCQLQNADGEASSSMVSKLASETHCRAERPGLDLMATESALPAAGGEASEQMKQALERDAFVLRVNLGQKPTPGYSAELGDVQRDGESLLLDMKATEPAPDAMVSQVITTPCVVLEVPSSGWSRLEVRMDAEGFPLTLEHPNPG